ncbi:MAG: carboxypeptidase-like regulatory domain-containing protein [Flavobacteriales bacterium]|nr:carboxypeptidase-like regulatory domain-containing protein [Flavobacteriales bacterium]
MKKLTNKGIAVLTVLASLIISFSASAIGTGEIQGRVIDSITLEPVIGATVSYYVAGTLQGTVTDVEGYYKIKPLYPGRYDLTFGSITFTNRVIKGVVVSSEKITFMDDVLMSVNKLVTVVVIEYRDKLIDPADPTANHLGIDDIKRDPNHLSPMTLISTTSPGVVASPDGQQLYFRGERSEATMYIVDGVKTRNGMLGIPGSAIGHITVYTGGVPAKYGDFTGGVVVIETQSYFDIVSQRRGGL